MPWLCFDGNEASGSHNRFTGDVFTHQCLGLKYNDAETLVPHWRRKWVPIKLMAVFRKALQILQHVLSLGLVVTLQRHGIVHAGHFEIFASRRKGNKNL